MNNKIELSMADLFDIQDYAKQSLRDLKKRNPKRGKVVDCVVTVQTDDTNNIHVCVSVMFKSGHHDSFSCAL